MFTGGGNLTSPSKTEQERIFFVADNNFILNPTIELDYVPSNSNSEIISINGLIQDPNSYSISGNTLTFIENYFKEGDLILIKYWRNN